MVALCFFSLVQVFFRCGSAEGRGDGRGIRTSFILRPGPKHWFVKQRFIIQNVQSLEPFSEPA